MGLRLHLGLSALPCNQGVIDPLALILQVTGGELLFNPGSNEPTGVDTLYLVVGQSFSVSTFGTKLVLRGAYH